MDESGNSAEEKIFNLRLLVQKLEEELLLYRNGTSMSELLDVIHEKDIEIETWRAKHDEKEEKLKRIAKTSGDVLIKYERLQQELIRQEQMRQTEEVHIQTLLADNERLVKDMDHFKMEINELHGEIKKREDEIGSLRLAQWESEQEQNIRQTSYQKELSKSQDDHQQEILLLQATIERLEVSARDTKAREESLQQEVNHWKTCAEEQDTSIASLQRRCASLVKDKNERLSKLDEERQEMVQQVQQFRDNMNENLRQRDDAIRKKDEKVRELTFQVNILQQELRLKNQRLAQGFGVDTADSEKDTTTKPSSTASSSSGSVKSSSSNSSSNSTGGSGHSSNNSSNGSSNNGIVVISQDDNLVFNATDNKVSSSRTAKRPALSERTNSLANDAVPTADATSKKSVKLVDYSADTANTNAANVTKVSKTVRIADA